MTVEWFSKTALVTKMTMVDRASFPVIDAHNHLGSDFGGGWDQKPVKELVDVLDEAGVYKFVDLDGGWGEDILQKHLDHFKSPYPDKFKVFGGVNWAKWSELGSGFPDWAANRLREQARMGAEGLKIWKPLGLSIKDDAEKLVRVNDDRLDPIWETAAELGLPVLIHVGDPAAFFWPLDEENERWDELHHHPEWHFPSPPYPPLENIVNDMADLVRRQKKTTFIGAHVGCYPENLAWVSSVLEECPNFYVDISARIGELGRQPYSARKLMLRFADRILFGTDSSARVETYRLHYRFLETDDEYFDYSLGSFPPQGRYRIYGLYLPKDVLEKIYYKNAERVIWGA
jgi:predicted TIM-barrel fold metal-dependent hydrolase